MLIASRCSSAWSRSSASQCSGSSAFWSASSITICKASLMCICFFAGCPIAVLLLPFPLNCPSQAFKVRRIPGDCGKEPRSATWPHSAPSKAFAACNTRPKQDLPGYIRVSTIQECSSGRRDNVIPLIANGRVMMEVLDREPLAIVEDVKMAIGLRKDFAEKVCAVTRLQELYAIKIPPTEVPDLSFPISARILAIQNRRQVFREVFPQEVPKVLIRVNILPDILFRFELVRRNDALFQLFFLLFKTEFQTPTTT